jgi:hypothetical protein
VDDYGLTAGDFDYTMSLGESLMAVYLAEMAAQAAAQAAVQPVPAAAGT